METCSVCGYDIIPGDSFCTNCGVRHNRTPAQASPDAYARTATATAVNSQPAAADLYQPPEQARTAPDGLAMSEDQPGQTLDGWQSQPLAGNAYARTESPRPAPGEFSAGPLAAPGGAAASHVAPAPPAAVDVGRALVPAGFSVPQRAAVCPNCGQAWTGSQACIFCGQVWGLPKGITLSSAGRRFGGYLLEGLLFICTLGIGWIIWTLVAWAHGQTPAKQVLGTRVVRLDTRAHAGWGRMFLRDFIGKLLVSLTFGLLFIGGVIADCWLLWDKDKQELWDKIAGTVVVNDPEKLLIPSAQAS
jgi:uncharacterized RDD family membrane protein YckC